MSSCATCGQLCEPFPITDLASLALYKTRGCTVISGDLYIINLPSSISKSTLVANLQSITRIHGMIYVLNNEFITSLKFFGNVVELYGGYYLNNPNLVDTRLTSLESLASPVVVEGCSRLCLARYTAVVGTDVDDSGCPNLAEEFFFNIQGTVTIADLPTFASVISRATMNISSGAWQGSVSATMIEGGSRWMSVQTVANDVPPDVSYLSPLVSIVNGGKLPLYARNSAEVAFFASNNVSLSCAPFLVAESSGFNGGDAFMATPTLGGVQLQFTLLFEPYALNFVQYRQVANLTLSVSGNDVATPWLTLPMVFDSNAHTFLIPTHALLSGTYYELRQGYPFPTYTYFSDSVIAKTFDASSPFVNHVTPIATNESLAVYWQQPEYADGIVGYQVRVLFAGVGNGGLGNASLNVSLLNVFATYQVPLTQTSVFVGCSSGPGNNCLAPSTTYLLEFTVIRQTGSDTPSYVYASTLQTVAAAVTDFIFVHGGWIVVDMRHPIPFYNGTPITSTVLAPAYVVSSNGNINVTLTASSTVTSTSNSSMKIAIGDVEYGELVSQLALHAYSGLNLVVGDPTWFPLTSYCLHLLMANAWLTFCRSKCVELRCRVWRCDGSQCGTLCGVSSAVHSARLHRVACCAELCRQRDILLVDLRVCAK